MNINALHFPKNYRINFSWAILIVLFLILNTCNRKEDHHPPIQPSEILEPLELAYLDNLPSSQYTADDIMLPGGTKLSDFLEEMDRDLYNRIYNLKKSAEKEKSVAESKPFQQKNLLLAKMLGEALILTNRNMFVYTDEGPDSPGQHGLAYSYGQKDHTKRQPPPAKTLTLCTDALYGLDCSGLIYQLSKKAGLILTADPYGECNAQFESDTLTWSNAFQNNANFKKLRMQNMGKLAVADIQVGDLIFWLRSDLTAYHVGMVLYASEGVGAAVYMSCGCATSCDEQGCVDNYSDQRGPRQVLLSDPKWFNKNYKILRIKADMFPFKHVQFGIGSFAIYSELGKEVKGSFVPTSNFDINTSGNIFTGSVVNTYSGTFTDSIEIELDPELLLITSFKFKRDIKNIPIGDYTHYEKMIIVNKGSPIQGKWDYYGGEISGATFSVIGLDLPNRLDITYEFNRRELVGMSWVVSEEKLKQLVVDQASFLAFYFFP